MIKTKNQNCIIETKGTGFDEMVSTDLKNTQAIKYCKKISKLTNKEWVYKKIVEDDFTRFNNLNFTNLCSNIK